MNILMVNATDRTGGAGRAAYRLHCGLRDQGINSELLVQLKKSNDPTVSSVYPGSLTGKLYGRFRPLANSLLQKTQITSNPIIHSANFLPSAIHRKINNSVADIVHLHWVNKEMISIREISKINKPIVWTLHDMWAFSGAEHHDDLQSPGRYKTGYHKENRSENHGGLDIDKWTWKRKLKYWQDKNLFIVTPSKWLKNCARESTLFNKKDICVIPNGLNVDKYKPVPQNWAKQILNIKRDDNTKYILFGAKSATSDANKGFKELKKAIEVLTSIIDTANYHLIVFGSEGHGSIDFGLPTTFLGELKDDETLALAYSAADVMIVPSLQENLPNTAIEAIACGTPVVAFKIGGLPDIVDHKMNGYLAEPYYSEDLAEGIAWILEDKEKLNRLKKSARNKALDEFDIKKVVQQYNLLYKSIMDNRSSDPLPQ